MFLYDRSMRDADVTCMPMNELDTKGGTHTYLAVAYSKKKGPYVTMYWQPELKEVDGM